MVFKKIIFLNRYVELETPPPFVEETILNFHFDYLKPSLTSPLSLFPIVFPKIVKSQVSTSLKILAKFQFQNLDQTLCSKSEPNISLKKVTKTRLKFNCAHLRSTKESLTFKYFDTGRYWLVLGQYRTVRVDI